LCYPGSVWVGGVPPPPHDRHACHSLRQTRCLTHYAALVQDVTARERSQDLVHR
jgi:hypothetical protein